MNAPDKIYINVNPLGVDYSIVPIPDFGGVEYLRKDALLEWAKSKKAMLKQGYKHDWKNDDMLRGGTLILDSLIDKIESL